jgi:hypothetical protein
MGRLLMVVKSAHVYETEFGYVRDVLAAGDAGRMGLVETPGARVALAAVHDDVRAGDPRGSP